MELTAEQIRDSACKLISERKGRDVTIINVGHLTIIADYFIICSATSTTQVKGIANNIDDEFAKIGLEPLRREGIADGRWAILDYGSVIIHIFNDETRLLFCLEQLWGDGKNIEKYELKI